MTPAARHPVDVAADLTVTITPPSGDPHRVVLTGSGSDLTLDLHDLNGPGFAPTLDQVGDLGEVLADWGVVVHVRSGGTRVVSVGAVSTRWHDRAVFRSGHVRLARLRDTPTALRLWRAARRQPDDGETLLQFPSTPLPLAPTVVPRRLRRVTTTHDPGRGGSPRLYVHPDHAIAPGPTHEVPLRGRRTRIGSGSDVDLHLGGIDALAAEVVHTDADEFVVVRRGETPLYVQDEVAEGGVLRTGIGFTLGAHLLNFVRDEYADHGRPYGGRQGGELGRQRPQAPRRAAQS